MKVIIIADDFGMSKGVNLGILEGFLNGVVTSTSMMTNMPGFYHGIEIMKEHKNLDVGIHFVLTTGQPLSPKDKINSLLNNSGNFEHNIERLAIADKEELKLELETQLKKFLDTGFTPSHIDFHHEVNFAKNAVEVAIEIAKEYSLPMRGFEEHSRALMDKSGVKHPQRFLHGFYGDNLTTKDLINQINLGKEEEIIEIMCHPAFVDKFLLDNSSYNRQRVIELDILTNIEIINFVKEKNIKLINFKEI